LEVVDNNFMVHGMHASVKNFI